MGERYSAIETDRKRDAGTYIDETECGRDGYKRGRDTVINRARECESGKLRRTRTCIFLHVHVGAFGGLAMISTKNSHRMNGASILAGKRHPQSCCQHCAIKEMN